MRSKLINRYEPIFRAIAFKITKDADLREDLIQEAWLGVYTIPAAKMRTIQNRDAYIRMVARNSMISYIRGRSSGDWYASRGEKKSRYVRIDNLLANGGIQIDTHGNLHPGEHSTVDAGFVTRRLDEGGSVTLLRL